MQILLVSATELEIMPFLQQKPAFHHLITGVGSPAAIYHIAKRVQQLDYDLVIQAGIAGTFQSAISLGDVVIVKEDVFADIGISEKNNFYTIFETGFADENDLPFKNGWLENNGILAEEVFLKKVKSVTINTVTDNKDQINSLISKYDPQIETMEGAALHYVCLQENIPFLQLRSISNDVGERDKTKWKMKESIENLNSTLITIVEQLMANT